MADNNVVLEEATKAIIHCGSLPNSESTLEIVLNTVTDVNQIQDEIVFGEFYPETSLTGQYASTDIYKGYKFISQEEPFCCIIKIFLPVGVYQIDFYKDNTPIENGSFVFYKYENFSYEYDIIHDYNGILKYIKTYPYLEEEPELTYHKRCKISHTKDTETLVEIFDQSILSEKFADLPVNANLSHGSQIINGNLITKDMHLLYLGNLTRDNIYFDSPDGGYEKIPLVGDPTGRGTMYMGGGFGINLITEQEGTLNVPLSPPPYTLRSKRSLGSNKMIISPAPSFDRESVVPVFSLLADPWPTTNTRLNFVQYWEDDTYISTSSNQGVTTKDQFDTWLINLDTPQQIQYNFCVLKIWDSSLGIFPQSGNVDDNVQFNWLRDDDSETVDILYNEPCLESFGCNVNGTAHIYMSIQEEDSYGTVVSTDLGIIRRTYTPSTDTSGTPIRIASGRRFGSICGAVNQNNGTVYLSGEYLGIGSSPNGDPYSCNSLETYFLYDSSTGNIQYLKADSRTTADIDPSVEFAPTQVKQVVIDNDGYVYLLGFTSESFTGYEAGENNLFVQKFTANGILVWTRQYTDDNLYGGWHEGFAAEYDPYQNNIHVAYKAFHYGSPSTLEYVTITTDGIRHRRYSDQLANSNVHIAHLHSSTSSDLSVNTVETAILLSSHYSQAESFLYILEANR